MDEAERRFPSAQVAVRSFLGQAQVWYFGGWSLWKMQMKRCTEGSVQTSTEYLTQLLFLESNIFMPKQILATSLITLIKLNVP